MTLSTYKSKQYTCNWTIWV